MTEFKTHKTLVNEIEAALRLGLCPTTLRRWRWAGTGPSFIKLGGAVRYDVAEIERFIEAGVRQSTSDLGPVDLEKEAA
jgi:predicted DNA-binding transcriptional regulator AlpA